VGRIDIHEPRRHAVDVSRWTIYRKQSGLWLEDCGKGELHGPLPTMARTLGLVERTITEDTKALIESVPNLLGRRMKGSRRAA
jgi:hypothetical protein